MLEGRCRHQSVSISFITYHNYFNVCMFVCGVHICMWVHVCTCLQVHEEMRRQLLGSCSFFGLRFGLSLVFNVTKSSRLAQPLNSRDPPSSASHPTNTGIASVQHWPQVFLQGPRHADSRLYTCEPKVLLTEL